MKSDTEQIEILQRSLARDDARIDWLEKELKLQKEFYEAIIQSVHTNPCPWCGCTGEHFRCRAFGVMGNVRSR